MTTQTKETTMTQVAPATPNDGNAKVHSGPIARLLASVSRLAEEHAEYKLSQCAWRRISI